MSKPPSSGLNQPSETDGIFDEREGESEAAASSAPSNLDDTGMLIFSDVEKFIRFFRVHTDEEGKITRVPLGRVSKVTFEIEPGLAEELRGDERAEVESIVSGYIDAEQQRKRSNALALPVILREAMEHLESDATETERAFIMGAVVEAVRRMRKFQRQS
jgi:hypothetical protein